MRHFVNIGEWMKNLWTLGGIWEQEYEKVYFNYCIPTVLLFSINWQDVDRLTYILKSQPIIFISDRTTPSAYVYFCFFILIFLIFIFTLFYFTILYWFCHTLTWICHRCAWVPKHEPPSHLPPHIISLDHPRAPAPSILLMFNFYFCWCYLESDLYLYFKFYLHSYKENV